MKLITAGLVLMTTPIFAGPFIVAHRGASLEAPENTVPAFQLAWKQGADAIEGDFHLTKDGKVICIHDYDTARVSGTRRIVRDSTLAELQALDAGARFKREWKGTRLPTFPEVAATVPAGRKLYLEVKCGPEIVPILLREIAASGLTNDQIVLISFNAPVILEMKKQVPRIRAFLLSSFKKGSPLNPSVEDALKSLRETRADGFSTIADKRVDAVYVRALRDAGFEYHTWTIDDPAVARRFLDLGALSITTNRPAFLREALAKD